MKIDTDYMKVGLAAYIKSCEAGFRRELTPSERAIMDASFYAGGTAALKEAHRQIRNQIDAD